MQWNSPDKYTESPYERSPWYIPEGARRTVSKFFWWPTRINEVTYWLETRHIVVESVHRWYGGSEGGKFVDWDIIRIHEGS